MTIAAVCDIETDFRYGTPIEPDLLTAIKMAHRQIRTVQKARIRRLLDFAGMPSTDNDS